MWVEDRRVTERICRQKAARMAAKEAAESLRKQRHDSAPMFFDNIDTSGGRDTCHRWTGETIMTSYTEPSGYEHGVFEYEGCSSKIATRVLCYALFGREVPRDRDVTPICGDHMCMNVRHLCVSPKGGTDKLRQAVPVEEFYSEGVGTQ